MKTRTYPPTKGLPSTISVDRSGNIATSGSVSGALSKVEVTGSSALSNQQCLGTLITNYGMASGGDTTIYAVAASTICTVLTEAASQAWSLKPPTGEAFVLDGTALDANDEIDVGQAVGDYLTLMRVRTGASAWQWRALSGIGAHTDGGAS